MKNKSFVKDIDTHLIRHHIPAIITTYLLERPHESKELIEKIYKDFNIFISPNIIYSVLKKLEENKNIQSSKEKNNSKKYSLINKNSTHNTINYWIASNKKILTNFEKKLQLLKKALPPRRNFSQNGLKKIMS